MSKMNTRSQAKQSSSNAPVYKYWCFGVEAAVWCNTKDGKDTYSVTLRKSYKDEDGNWKETNNLFSNDVLNAARALEHAHAYIVSQYNE